MRVASIFAVSAALLLTGCVVPTGPVEVTRFNRVAEGQVYGKGSFEVMLADPANDGLALSPYSASVAREMQRLGYVDAAIAGQSDVVAAVTVDISERKTNAGSPVSVGIGGNSGGYRAGVGLGIGLNLGGGSKTQIVTSLSVKIRRRIDNAVIWEGRASQAAGKSSPAAQPGIAASKLASALFSGFPGNNGETVTMHSD